jgi:hypothetical protein
MPFPFTVQKALDMAASSDQDCAMGKPVTCYLSRIRVSLNSNHHSGATPPNGVELVVGFAPIETSFARRTISFQATKLPGQRSPQLCVDVSLDASHLSTGAFLQCLAHVLLFRELCCLSSFIRNKTWNVRLSTQGKLNWSEFIHAGVLILGRNDPT